MFGGKVKEFRTVILVSGFMLIFIIFVLDAFRRAYLENQVEGPRSGISEKADSAEGEMGIATEEDMLLLDPNETATAAGEKELLIPDKVADDLVLLEVRTDTKETQITAREYKKLSRSAKIEVMACIGALGHVAFIRDQSTPMIDDCIEILDDVKNPRVGTVPIDMNPGDPHPLLRGKFSTVDSPVKEKQP